MLGATELSLLMGLVVLVLAVVPLASAIDAVKLPGPAWKAVGMVKWFWVALLAAGVPLLGLGLVFALVYVIGVRPKVAVEAATATT